MEISRELDDLVHPKLYVVKIEFSPITRYMVCQTLEEAETYMGRYKDDVVVLTLLTCEILGEKQYRR